MKVCVDVQPLICFRSTTWTIGGSGSMILLLPNSIVLLLKNSTKGFRCSGTTWYMECLLLQRGTNATTILSNGVEVIYRFSMVICSG